MKQQIEAFEEFRYMSTKNSLLIAIFIAMSFEILRLFNVFPPSKLIVFTTFLLIITLVILYKFLLENKIKLLYIQLSSFFIIITYIIFQTSLVSYHKFLPIWIDFSIIISFIIMDRKYALIIALYSLLGIIFIYKSNEYNLEFFSFFTLMFSIIAFATLGYVISLQLMKYEEENKRQKSKLNRLTLIDELTQVLNRRGFFNISHKILKEAKKENKKVAVLMLDIDFFKNVNDTYGHEAGDEVLKKISDIIKQMMKKNDIFGRVGGEEFAILLYDVNIDNVKKMTNKILNNIRKTTILYNREKIKVTISIGAYCFDEIDDKCEIKNFLFQADKALYEAKNSGRDKAVCCINN